MKSLGLDVGSKTIGVALSDAFGWTAQGVETLRRTEGQAELDYQAIAKLVQENEVSTVVVGLPKNMDGTIGGNGEHCQAFAKDLSSYIDAEIVMWDERLTTMAAKRVLVEADVSRKKRKQVIDKMAATLILQGYLDRAGKTL
ncbi:Holliday junction resolvase RuvX [Alkalicoccobacillus plakortidis]|uniref:Putative pre-16S rRNA nuclease n=1 Tax=Alkalicoccobacillus plakortidis TaxID=444060 RepID=A0ABT0XKX8_9BACI|nr:Holliday junction resolvase RuvX [Alkalicoccobacillus plakortidis]MCM2676564.1 Holliday junction resolvase RuvX [Alkalicoccobacillus plakortidis]